MVQGFGNTCMKFILFIFNFFFVAIGVALMALGGYVLTLDKNLNQIIDTPDKQAVFVIVVGLIVFVVAFFGCCGASSESSCMLSTYAVVVGMVFLFEIALAIVLLIYNNEVPRYLEEGLNKAFGQYSEKMPNPDVGAIDFLQSSFKCCGPDGPNYWRSRDISVPKSCCTTIDRFPDSPSQCDASQAWRDGCVKAVNDFVDKYTVIISCVLIFAGAIKIIAACFACSLANAVQY